MIVVGGIYGERSVNPSRPLSIFGSGLRAAVAISRAAKELRLVSACSDTEKPYVDSLSKAHSLTVELAHRPYAITFVYETPFSPPSVLGQRAAAEEISVTGDVILVFGMLEATPKVVGERVVVDPQSPGITDLNEGVDVRASSLAIVGNQTEISGLGNNHESIEDCAHKVRERYGADVVVVKRGAVGALVVTEGLSDYVGPFPSERVWPIGSGDVFSAVFAWAWGQQEMGPIDASRIAARATASWCANGPHAVVTEAGQVVAPGVGDEKTPKEVRIYLAGPFFNLSQRWLVNLARGALVSLGATVFSPLHDVGAGPADTIATADLEGLRTSDAVLALLDNTDPGTLFEVGYATSAGIPVVGFAEDPDADDLKMPKGVGTFLVDDLPTALYQSVWKALD